jgi:hypothetical protein
MKTISKMTRRLIIALSVLTLFLSGALVVVIFLARQDAGTHYNLSYLLWKSGLKPYEQSIALPGMTHDKEFRQELHGITPSEFEKRFPSTFYEVKTLPSIAKPGQRYFINDYQQAQREEGGFSFVWLAVFDNDRLIELDVFKGT